MCEQGVNRGQIFCICGFFLYQKLGHFQMSDTDSTEKLSHGLYTLLGPGVKSNRGRRSKVSSLKGMSSFENIKVS